MAETSGRLNLPFISPGQAQKEMTHNEALTLADMLVQPVVRAVAPAVVPALPALGQCWIVGLNAQDAWTGYDNALASWTAGGWRFATPFDGMTAWSLADQMAVSWRGSEWVKGDINARAIRINNVQIVTARQPAVAAPDGGGVVDAESRAAISAILATLRTHGLIAS